MRTFFALCTVYLAGPLLDRAPRTIGRFQLQWWLKLLFCYEESRERVKAWHREELEKLDTVYELQQAGSRLMKAREKAHEEGISPLDPRYPDLWDFVDLPKLERILRPELKKAS